MSGKTESGGKVLPFRGRTGAPEELSDDALVAAIGSGDPAALAALFDRHHQAVHRFLARLSGVDGTDADDLLQETFLGVFESARRFRGDAPVKMWLLGIASNVARRSVRTQVRQKSRAAVFLAALDSEAPSPAREVETNELMGRLRDALLDLPHDLRAAFLLCDVEGARGVDAARALGLREGTLYRRLHEARLALRAALDGGKT